MIRSLVRSVIRDARVTHSGGAALQVDAWVLHAADILPLEEVEIVNNATGERFRTWVEAANEGSGEVHVRAARAGDTISIICYGLFHEGQTVDHKPRVVQLDAQNKVVSVT